MLAPEGDARLASPRALARRVPRRSDVHKLLVNQERLPLMTRTPRTIVRTLPLRFIAFGLVAWAAAACGSDLPADTTSSGNTSSSQAGATTGAGVTTGSGVTTASGVTTGNPAGTGGDGGGGGDVTSSTTGGDGGAGGATGVTSSGVTSSGSGNSPCVLDTSNLDACVLQ